MYLFLRGLCGQESQISSHNSTQVSDVAGVYPHTPPRIVIELLDLACKDARTATDVLSQIQSQPNQGLPPFLPSI